MTQFTRPKFHATLGSTWAKYRCAVYSILYCIVTCQPAPTCSLTLSGGPYWCGPHISARFFALRIFPPPPYRDTLWQTHNETRPPPPTKSDTSIHVKGGWGHTRQALDIAASLDFEYCLSSGNMAGVQTFSCQATQFLPITRLEKFWRISLYICDWWRYCKVWRKV